jgi:CubicO group peptidase (beta-lactamase class C family)
MNKPISRKEMHMNTILRTRVFVSLVCLIVILSLAPGKVNASPTLQSGTDFAAIDAYVSEQMDNLGIPGMVLGIVQEGQIAHLKGFGAADSSGRAVTPQTPFGIASLTKSFTALAVMQLVEEGKIDLDAPVQTYLPWFELADKQASARITVRNLLNQTSGISGKDGNRDLVSPLSLEELVRTYNSFQPTQPVGQTFQYSNPNYNIAGLIVEKVSGQSYGDYVTQHIFGPLDMRHSYASRAPALADGLVEGYHYMFGHAFKWELAAPPGHLPSGYLISSAEDMAHYAIAQLNDGEYNDAAILSPQGIAELHAPAIPMGGKMSYAMGWAVTTLDGIPVVLHGGKEFSALSMLILVPESKSGVILLSNANGFVQSNQVDGIAINIVGMLNGKPPVPVSPPFHYSFLTWTILLTPFLQILGIVFIWRKWRNKGIGHIFLTVIVYGTCAVLLLVGVPQLLGMAIWDGMRNTFPELCYGVIVGATLGIGWSVLYTAMSLKARKSK